MAIYEFDVEREIKKLRQSEFEYGVDVGRKEGREEGIKEGLISGILQTCQELGLSKDQTLDRILKNTSIDHDFAVKYLESHWKNN